MGESTSPPSQGAAAEIAEAVAQHGKPAGQKSRHERKREQIVRAAMELFATRDFKDVRMEEVAMVAGVGKGTLYRYFRTKDDLFVQTVLWATDRAIEHLRSHLAKATGTQTKLREVIWHMQEYFRENDALFHILHHDKVNHSCALKEEIHEKRARLRHLTEEMIAEGVASGTFRQVDPGFCATILWGMLRTTRHWFSDHDPATVTEQVADLFLKGVQS
jgi:TetR/AcrR family fatty acid metabolism transcriptional regulator